MWLFAERIGVRGLYFGSVRFFKDLILGTVFLIIVVSLGLAIFFGVKYNTLLKETETVSSTNIETQQPPQTPQETPPADEVVIPDGTTLEEIYAILREKGYSDEEILTIIGEENPTVFDAYIEKTKAERNAPEYTRMYDNLYVEGPSEVRDLKDNTIYLTFDDGPSQYTLEIVRLLDEYDIKATFFMSGSESPEGMEIMRKVAESGHTIGIHSMSHDYDEIYASPEAFLEDMNNTAQNIYEATGVKPDIYRFAGGSKNNHNKEVYDEIVAEVERRGYVYYDWNVSGEDATEGATWTSIYRNVLDGVEQHDSSIVLLHNKYNTLTVTEDLIIALKNRGYEFAPLTNEDKPIQF